MPNPLLVLPPETAHKVALWGVRNGLAGNCKKPQGLSKVVLDLTFSSPVGLSAGADKEAYALGGWSKIGFGFVETGTVTIKPRAGNPKPRVWRQPSEHSVVNWMGLPGSGLEHFLRNIKAYRATSQKDDLIVGVSIASPEGNLNDFETLARECRPYADYLTLNASCPNVEHGEKDDALKGITEQIATVVKEAKNTPVLLKLGPTNDIGSLRKTLKAAQKAGAAGFVLTNTVPPTSKDLLGDIPFEWPQHEDENVGGYSGPRLLSITENMVKHARNILGKDFPIIGVGGIQSGEDAKLIMTAGADLVQVYTGFIYKGPCLIKEINTHLSA